MRIEKAKPDNAEVLTALTIRSKSFWNYTKKQLEDWEEDLTVNETYIEHNYVFKLIVDDVIIGFYAYNFKEDNIVVLDFFFLDPDFIGLGYGKMMLHNFIKQMKNENYNTILLDADPNAETFYQKNGFITIGKRKTKIKDRYLPIMELQL